MSKNKGTDTEKKGKGKFVAGGVVGVGAAALLAYFAGLIPGLGNGTSFSVGSREMTTAPVTTQAESTDATTALTTTGDAVTTAPETTSETTTTTETTTTEKQPVFIEITVSGNGYTYQNRNYADTDLKKLITELDAAAKSAGADAMIRITDQEASLNAYKALIEKLDEVHLRYEEVKP